MIRVPVDGRLAEVLPPPVDGSAEEAPVPYTAPSGWLEPRPTGEGQRLGSTFHRERDCDRVRDAELLTETDRPYSAVRCRVCAAA